MPSTQCARRGFVVPFAPDLGFDRAARHLEIMRSDINWPSSIDRGARVFASCRLIGVLDLARAHMARLARARHAHRFR